MRLNGSISQTQCAVWYALTHILSPNTHSQHNSQSHPQLRAYTLSRRNLALSKVLLLSCHQTLQSLQIKSLFAIWIIGCPRSIKIYKNEKLSENQTDRTPKKETWKRGVWCWTNEGSKRGEEEQRGKERKGNSAGQKMSGTSVKRRLKRGRERIMGSGGDGLLRFLQSCLSMLPGDPFSHLSERQVWNTNGCLHVLWTA